MALKMGRENGQWVNSMDGLLLFPHRLCVRVVLNAGVSHVDEHNARILYNISIQHAHGEIQGVCMFKPQTHRDEPA